MAVLLVQHAFFDSGGTKALTNSVSFASTPTPGNLIILAITYFGHHGGLSQRLTGVADNQTGNTYTQVQAEESANNNGAADFVDLYYVKNVNATGTFTVTGTWNGTENPNMAIYEYSGADTTAPLTTSNFGTGASGTNSPGSVTPANNGSLIFMVGVDDNGNNTTVTPQTNFTIEDHEYDSSTHERFYTQDLVQTTAAAITASVTIATSSNWASIVGVFKPAAAAGSQIFPSLAMTGVGV